MKSRLEKLITEAVEKLFGIPKLSFSVEHPAELSHGDYATNVALVAAKQAGKSPKEVAETLAKHLEEHKEAQIASVSVAGPGFINFTIAPSFFSRVLSEIQSPTYAHNSLFGGKKIMVEYTDPNPFKPFHIGHLMTNAIGESIARLIEVSGARVIRANYQGDIGPHVAKAIWGIMQKGKPDPSLPVSAQAQYIGECYAFGSGAYEDDPKAKGAIDVLNKKLYERSDESLNELYEWGRKVTLDAFEVLYKTLGTRFDYYFFESEMADKGIVLVKEFLSKGVFEESEGAVIFRGEKYDPKLHTRVFITSNDLPTYETKELGLTKTKFDKEPEITQSIVVTAVEQKDYMAVATEAMRQIDAESAAKMKHITHGMMRFASGKMSSRKGNVVTGESLIHGTIELVKERMKDRNILEEERGGIAEAVAVGAIKYAILKQAIGADIIYDEAQALSFEGDSGPYLQYTAIRARSALRKAEEKNIAPATRQAPAAPYEIERILYRFNEVVARAAETYEPHHLITFLTEVASAFNSFYAKEILVDEHDVLSGYKLALTAGVLRTLTEGLSLLGIKVPERM